MSPYDPEKHYRQSIRLKGHNYAGGGVYFVTICAKNRAPAYFSGFHSPMEKQIFERLLEAKRPLIWCPAWGLDRAASDPAVRQALEENRMLVLEMRNADGDLAAAEARNQFVIQQADSLWTPHINPGGMLDRLLNEKRTANEHE